MGVEAIIRGETLKISPSIEGKRRGALRLSLPYIFFLLIVAGLIFMYLWTRVTVVKLGYEIASFSALEKGLIQENRELKIQFDTIMSPKNLERLGIGELGLVYPENGQIVPIIIDEPREGE